MGLKKKRSVIVAFRRNKHVVDYRDESGKRIREAFDNETLAEDRRLEIELRFMGFIPADAKIESITETHEAPRPRVSIKDAIKNYRAVADGTQMTNTKKVERYHFESLWMFLVNDQQIGYLDEIKLVHLDIFQSRLLKGSDDRRPLAASTVNRMFFGTFSPFFNKCVAWGLIAKSPMHGPNGQKGLKRLPEADPEIIPWKPEHVRIALEGLEPHVAEAIYFQGETGCREIDITRAIWDDMKLESRKVKFTSYKGGKITTSYLPMSDRLFEFISAKHEQARRKFKANGTDPVFANTRGRPLTADYIGKAVARLRKAPNEHGELQNPQLAGLTPYGIRHGFIDGLVSLGIHPRDIQLLARHADFKTTTRYTHRRNEHLRAVVNSASDTLREPVTEREEQVTKWSQDGNRIERPIPSVTKLTAKCAEGLGGE